MTQARIALIRTIAIWYLLFYMFAWGLISLGAFAYIVWGQFKSIG